MITHYLELFRYYKRFVITGTVAAAVATLVLTVFLLVANPFYKAVATVTMQPTEAELAFTKGWLGVSQFNPASILTQTHIEQLLSRPVAEKALSLLIENSGNAAPPPTGIKETFRKVMRAIKRSFWRLWNTLNYGKHIPLSDSEEALVSLMEATDVEVVEGSYIMNIEVLYDDPVIAAKAANILAEAYVLQTQSDYSVQSNALREYLNKLVAEKEQELADLLEEALRLRTELNISDIAFEREAIVESRDREIEKQNDDNIKLSSLDSKVESLKSSKNNLNRSDMIEKIDNDLTLSQSERAGLITRIKERGTVIRQLNERLVELQGKERQFERIQQRKDEVQADLSDLRGRLVTVSLANSSGLSQVRMISPSVAPLYPWFPKVFIMTVAAAIVGFVLMALVVVVLDTLGRRVITSEVLRRLAGVRSLGSLTQSMREKIKDKEISGEVKSLQSSLKQRISFVDGWQKGILGITAVGDSQLIDEVANCFDVLLNNAASENDSINIVRLPPVNERFDRQSSGLGQNPIVCALRPGEVDESEIEMFIEFAGKGVTSDQLFFVMVNQ